MCGGPGFVELVALDLHSIGLHLVVRREWEEVLTSRPIQCDLESAANSPVLAQSHNVVVNARGPE